MSDEKLLNEVAILWVNSGGDAEGLDWAYQQLKQAIQAELNRRKSDEDEARNDY